jgi:carnitine O-acetyltransferase
MKIIAYSLHPKKNSWLEDIWLNKAYLEWREPSLINVNWWCQFIDHPKQPQDLLTHPPPKNVLTDFQITRAAGLVASLLDFKKILDT